MSHISHMSHSHSHTHTHTHTHCSATVQQVLKSVCQRRDLDYTHFLALLPPNSPDGQPIVCKGHMTVGELSTNEIHLSKRRKSPKRESQPDSNGKDQVYTVVIQISFKLKCY